MKELKERNIYKRKLCHNFTQFSLKRTPIFLTNVFIDQSTDHILEVQKQLTVILDISDLLNRPKQSVEYLMPDCVILLK